MPSKVFILIPAGDHQKAADGLHYAQRAKHTGMLEDVKVIFIGSAGNILLEGDGIVRGAREMEELDRAQAGAATAGPGVPEGIVSIGSRVNNPAPVISGFMKKGYTPMVL